MPGTHRESERTIEFAGQMADRANVPLRVEVGDPARSGAYHPHLSLGWRPGGDAREDEPGILRIGFADLGAISQAIPDTREATGLTIIGTNATARLYMPRADRLHFDLTINADVLRNRYTNGAGTEIRIPYDLTGGRGLAWSYQAPLLNGVDIGGGWIEGNEPGTGLTIRRLRAMDGGYAVYHASIRNDRNDGFGNWRRAGTGKICNVERPRAVHGVDTIWGRLEVAGGQLTLVFDAADFRGRVGPVVIDPDFGYTTIGGSVGDAHAQFNVHTLSESLDTTSLSAYINRSDDGNGTVQGAIYTDGGSYPDARRAAGDAVANNSSSGGWITSTSVVSSLTAADYYIGMFGGSTGPRLGHYFDSSSREMWYFTSTKTADDPFPAGASSAPRDLSVYVTGTATGGGGGNPWYYYAQQ